MRTKLLKTDEQAWYPHSSVRIGGKNFFCCSLPGGDGAVYGPIVPFVVGCFTCEEKRSGNRGSQFAWRFASAHQAVAVGAARKRIGLPIMYEADIEVAAQPLCVYFENAGQRFHGAINHSL